MRNIIDDREDFGVVQRAALDFGADRFKAVWLRCRRDRHKAAGGFGEAPECRFGEAEIPGADQRIVVGDQRGCQQYLGIAAQLDAAEPAKDFRAERV